MSYKVTEEVLRQSCAKHGTRLVLLAIAEVAHHDGVCFGLPQAPRRGREDRNESIAERANLTRRQVQRCIHTARFELDELEIRSYWKGSIRLHVYRVIVGRLRDLEADHPRLAELGIEPDLPFSTPALLAIPRLDRERLATGQIDASAKAPDEATSAPDRGDFCDVDEATSAPPHARASEQAPSLDPGPDPALDVSAFEEAESGDVPAGAGAEGDEVDELIKAFAEELGAWPNGRSEWGAWKKAFGELAAGGATAEQLRVRCRSYRERWPDIDLTPFGLTKHWLTIGASLLEGQFALLRWVYDRSWRLDPEQVAWIIEEANVAPAERERVERIAAEVRVAHSDAGSELLRWVEQGGGWALGDEEWRAQLRERSPVDPELRKQAKELRLEIRGALAGLQFGVATKKGDEAAA